MSSKRTEEAQLHNRVMTLLKKREYTQEESESLWKKAQEKHSNNVSEQRQYILQALQDNREKKKHDHADDDLGTKGVDVVLDDNDEDAFMKSIVDPQTIFDQVAKHQTLSSTRCKYCKVGLVYAQGKDKRLGLDEGQVIEFFCSLCNRKN
jgi:hypothetical protein